MHAEVSSFWSFFKSSLLKKRGNESFLRTWLDSVVSAQIEKTGDSYCCKIQTPSAFHKKYIQENVLKDLEDYLNQFLKRPCDVEFEVIPHLPLVTKNQVFEPQDRLKDKKRHFNSEYIFENFIVGSSNEFAYSAAVAAANKSDEFNPLFIYGPSGLGKTHLLNAIGQKALDINDTSKVVYLSAERFLNECVMAIQKREMDKFRKKYRSPCDFLLVDDIQMIAKGEKVQEEFFHTFNDLCNQGTKIVFCCDKQPSSIPKLEDRMRTRFEGGLIVDISYPDLETRLAIIKHKSKRKKLFLSKDTLLKIAKSCQNSIRETEGVLNKIKMMSDLYKEGLSAAHIQNILKDVSSRDLSVEDIQKIVAEKFLLSVEDLKSPTRKKNIVTARQTAMYLIRKHFKKPLSDIGYLFNKKDHTTVLNSIKKVESLLAKDPDFKRKFEDLNIDIHKSRLV